MLFLADSEMVNMSEGEIPHNTFRPMKLFSSIAAAVIGASFTAVNPAEAGYRCRSDGFGGQRCSGSINGQSFNSRMRSDGFGGTRTTGSFGGSSFSQRCRSDGFCGQRCN